MNRVIVGTVRQTSGRRAVVGHFARTSWSVANALVAVAAGISTLNMAVAHTGIATLNEVASPLMQQFVRLGRQA